MSELTLDRKRWGAYIELPELDVLVHLALLSFSRETRVIDDPWAKLSIIYKPRFEVMDRPATLGVKFSYVRL